MADLTVKKLKTGYSVKYDNKTLLNINMDTVTTLLADLLTKKQVRKLVKDLAEIKGLSGEAVPKKKTKKDRVTDLACQMVNLYTKLKRKHYRNKGIQPITKKDKEFSHFMKAAAMCVALDVDTSTFLSAQITGLAFANKGKGIFPNPNHLSTQNAQNRVLEQLDGADCDEEETTGKKEIQTVKLNESDKKLPLNDNPRFKRAYNRLMEGDATLSEAYFVEDCMTARKGYITEKVDKAIRLLESKDAE